MSEEERLINYLESIDITRIFYDNPPHDNHVGIGKALQMLLDLYNKEKEKNNTLEELLQGKLFELYKYYKDLASSYQANCISKDKIKEKIKYLMQLDFGTDLVTQSTANLVTISILKELLEEEK